MGPAICGGGIGARCFQRQSFVWGSPHETVLSIGETSPPNPALGAGYDEGASPPAVGQERLVNPHMRIR